MNIDNSDEQLQDQAKSDEQLQNQVNSDGLLQNQIKSNGQRQNHASRNSIIIMGVRDGFPIGLGYFAVSFSIGIIAQKAGVSALLGLIGSLFTRASAGEYGVYTMVLADATYIEVVVISLIANLRYLLMNTALSQRFSPRTPLFKRLLVGACCTDEIFGIAISSEGDIQPAYVFSAAILSGIMWALGTFFGIIAGGVLPTKLVSALSVALYGMFLAIIVPPSKKDRAVLFAVVASFCLSAAFAYLPVLSQISSGIRTILLTILISAVAAYLCPVKDQKEPDSSPESKPL